jgi:hypothetical protein
VKVPWLWIGGGLTLGIACLAYWVAQSQICVWSGSPPLGCITRWDYFLQSPPNEIGDSLAGFAGALAFVWLISTVGLQSQELAAQRLELRETRFEVGAQRVANEKMAEALSSQASVEERRLQYETEARYDLLADEVAEMLRLLLLSFKGHEEEWHVKANRALGSGPATWKFVSRGEANTPTRVFLAQQVEHLSWIETRLQAASARDLIQTKPHQEDRYDRLVAALDRIISISEDGSEACRERIKGWQIEEYRRLVERMMSNEKLWHTRMKTEVLQ